MKHKKILIVLIIVVVIICIICLISISLLRRMEEKQIEELGYVPEDSELLAADYKTEKLRNLTDFFSVEACIQKNINSTFEATDMNVLASDRLYSYSVYGEEKNEETGETTEEYFIVRVDTIALAYEIEELDSKEYDDIDEIDLTTDLTEIAQTENNQFEYTRINNENTCRFYLKNYTELLLSAPETAYDMLDEQYREERFSSSYEEFLEYIEENKTYSENAVLSQYVLDYLDDYTEITLVDIYNNSYKIIAKSVKDYTVQLDNYTIKDEEYLEKYEELSDSEKVSANVDTFINMINTKDFKHAYEVLDETFKNNNFNTLDVFKEYINNYFFEYNLDTKTGVNVYNQEGTYVYETTIKSGAGSAAESKKLTVIMQLQEGTDFKMSFSIE